MMGDYCLLAGSPRDAADHYSGCIPLCRSVDDHLWHAAAAEGMAAAHASQAAITHGVDGMAPYLPDIVDKCVGAAVLFVVVVFFCCCLSTMDVCCGAWVWECVREVLCVIFRPSPLDPHLDLPPRPGCQTQWRYISAHNVQSSGSQYVLLSVGGDVFV